METPDHEITSEHTIEPLNSQDSVPEDAAESRPGADDVGSPMKVPANGGGDNVAKVAKQELQKVKRTLDDVVESFGQYLRENLHILGAAVVLGFIYGRLHRHKK